MLQVTDLSKEYPTARGPLPVLSGMSFSLSPGDAAAIMGPSGSGKSSLLYLLGALEPPTSGTIVLDGRNPFELTPRELAAFRNKAVGFVFQDHCLLPQCTVLENVLIPTLVAPAEPDAPARLTAPRFAEGKARATSPRATYVGRGFSRASADEATARARDLVAQVGLADRIDHRPGELSGGERQRVAIARALVRQPRLLLCDEPTGNLDRASAEHVAALLLDLHRRQQTILIVVTHNETLASKFPIRYELIDRRLHVQV